MKSCVPFIIQTNNVTTVKQLYECGFFQIDNNTLYYRTMINKYLSACVTITSETPIKRVLIPKQSAITLKIIDETYLQPYNPTWSEISIEQCKNDLTHIMRLPTTMSIQEQADNEN